MLIEKPVSLQGVNICRNKLAPVSYSSVYRYIHIGHSKLPKTKKANQCGNMWQTSPHLKSLQRPDGVESKVKYIHVTTGGYTNMRKYT